MRRLRNIFLLLTMVLSLTVMAYAIDIEDAEPVDCTPYSTEKAVESMESRQLNASTPTIFLDYNYYELTIRQGSDLPLYFTFVGGGTYDGFICITDLNGNVLDGLYARVPISSQVAGQVYSVPWTAETASLPVGKYWVMAFIPDNNGDLVDPNDYDAVLLNVVSSANPLKSVSFFDAEAYAYDSANIETVTEVTLCPNDYHFYGLLYNPAATTTARTFTVTSSDTSVVKAYYYSGDVYAVGAGTGTATITVSAGNNVSAKLKVTVAHTYTKSITKAPTCSADGVMTYTCSCGHSYTESIPVDTEGGHDIKNITVITAPTACIPGQGSGLCSICRENTTCTIPSYFTDVAPDNYYSDAVDFFYANEIVKGVSTTEFGKDSSLTRGMLVTLLYRMEGEPACSARTPFTDVDLDEYYATPIAWAYQSGLANGMTNTTFEPDSPITREQLATFIYRYAAYKNVDTSGAASLTNYPDHKKVQSYATDALAWAVDAGIITGTSNYGVVYLSPDGNATRAQAVTMLYRYIGFAAENPAPEAPADPEDSIMVWIPKNSAKYHYDSDCPGTGSMEQVSLSYAKAVGYVSCSICAK